MEIGDKVKILRVTDSRFVPLSSNNTLKGCHGVITRIFEDEVFWNCEIESELQKEMYNKRGSWGGTLPRTYLYVKEQFAYYLKV